MAKAWVRQYVALWLRTVKALARPIRAKDVPGKTAGDHAHNSFP
ncbi:hypothetical protein C4K20_2544 [Pseudomonas chlororaphis subsp. aurantiaca]|nr:hypothetical protein C4K20_2544 [Pseudomonas chlororaphis subsp. aurantiaca]AZD66412.1 hypothetical protein C4K17_2526 [Pseudomonas chlororaphis subsp. aurantiaca]AZD79126.1 hypothetical protein C4K15_2559 [Pseudomonas chlororaphis subsp. aurantiaca]